MNSKEHFEYLVKLINKQRLLINSIKNIFITVLVLDLCLSVYVVIK